MQCYKKMNPIHTGVMIDGIDISKIQVVVDDVSEFELYNDIKFYFDYRTTATDPNKLGGWILHPKEYGFDKDSHLLKRWIRLPVYVGIDKDAVKHYCDSYDERFKFLV